MNCVCVAGSCSILLASWSGPVILAFLQRTSTIVHITLLYIYVAHHHIPHQPGDTRINHIFTYIKHWQMIMQDEQGTYLKCCCWLDLKRERERGTRGGRIYKQSVSKTDTHTLNTHTHTQYISTPADNKEITRDKYVKDPENREP